MLRLHRLVHQHSGRENPNTTTRVGRLTNKVGQATRMDAVAATRLSWQVIGTMDLTEPSQNIPSGIPETQYTWGDTAQYLVFGPPKLPQKQFPPGPKTMHKKPECLPGTREYPEPGTFFRQESMVN